MIGNFMYCNPTRVFFGVKALSRLPRLLEAYEPRVLFVYGRGSVKKSGLYDRIIDMLDVSSKTVMEIGGIGHDPTADMLRTLSARAGEFDPDFILAAGGGSVCDFAKALSVSIDCDEDPWERYYVRMQGAKGRIIPVGCIPTTAGTGSEMNGCAVISSPEEHLKIGHVFGDNVFPKFALLDPRLTYTLSRTQTCCGIFDIMTHLTEQYFSGKDDSATDYITEGMMRALITSSRIVLSDPHDYESRGNIMWLSSLALSTLLSKGKKTDWMIHMIGQSIGAYVNAPHAMTLSVITMPYYRYISQFASEKFARFAANVWNIPYAGHTSSEMASLGLDRLESWIKELRLPMNLTEIGVTKEMYPGIISGIKILKGGYKRLTREDIIRLLEQSAAYGKVGTIIL